MTTTADTSTRLEELRVHFSGTILAPADDGYDAARAVHNGAVDRRPALIARCANTADIVDAVSFARAEGLDISVRGGGHNVAGRAVQDGALMVDLSPMRSVYVDPAPRRPPARRAARSGSTSTARPPRCTGSRRPAARSRPPASEASRSAAVSGG